jgi:predicted RNA polymerase sigma factor
MELHASRLAARTGPDGTAVLLADQDRTRWDRLLIKRGLDNLAAIERLGGTVGMYALQAAIAARHARATTPQATDWQRITALYDGLVRINPSPVVELNRAVATGQAFGPEAGLEVSRRYCACRRWLTTTCWPPSSAICSAAPAAMTRHVRTSCERPR